MSYTILAEASVQFFQSPYLGSSWYCLIVAKNEDGHTMNISITIKRCELGRRVHCRSFFTTYRKDRAYANVPAFD